MNVQENISLKSFNTFGIDVSAKYFARFTTVDELHELLEFNQPQTSNPRPSFSAAAAISSSPKM